jgi:hypothetical protein
MRKEGEEVGFACDKKEIVRIPRLTYPSRLTLI